jgi:hypothetical protein
MACGVELGEKRGERRILEPGGLTLSRHREERSNEAIQRAEAQHWIASLRSQ